MNDGRQRIYLNNAASAWPHAPGVSEAVARALEAAPADPGRTASSAGDPLAECRQRLSLLLGGVSPERVALTQHATQALNIAIGGMGLQRGDRVVTSVTEHNSVLRPLAHLEERVGTETEIIGLDGSGRVDEDAYGAALQREPKLVVLNHASNVTGQVQEVASLFAQAHDSGAATLLDAAQSLGHLPVHPGDLHADMVAFTGHKGLLGPTGTGGLYVCSGLELEQTYVGGTGVRSNLRLHPPEMPMRLEAGTPNVVGLAGLAAALRWREENGIAFQRRTVLLAEQLGQGLRDTPGVRVFSDAEATQDLGITSFSVKGWECEETGLVLSQSYEVVCRAGLHCAPLIHASIGSAPQGTVRFSVSGFNTEDEIARALQAVRGLAR